MKLPNWLAPWMSGEMMALIGLLLLFVLLAVTNGLSHW